MPVASSAMASTANLTHRPTISAIIPVHNGRDFICQTIRSVLTQTYTPDEIIVVDDGSTDDTVRTLERFRGRIRLLRQSNRGVSTARNAGASAANGDFLAFLDADDIWFPEKTAAQLDVLTINPALGLVYSGIVVLDQTMRCVCTIPAPEEKAALTNTLLMEPPVLSIAQAALIRRTAFVQAGGFDPRFSTVADADLACRLALTTSIARTSQPLVGYRTHTGQMHRNLAALEREYPLLLRKLFALPDLPPELHSLRRRAEANYRYTLAGEYAHRGQRRRAARHLAAALFASPRRVRTLRH